MSYANQMILWRYLEVIESNSLGCLILEEKAVCIFEPPFLGVPLDSALPGFTVVLFSLGCLSLGWIGFREREADSMPLFLLMLVAAVSQPSSVCSLTLTFPRFPYWLSKWDTAVWPWFSTSVSIQQSVSLPCF